MGLLGGETVGAVVLDLVAKIGDQLSVSGVPFDLTAGAVQAAGSGTVRIFDYVNGSVSFVFDRPFDVQRLASSLNELLAVSGDDIFRVKGILHARGDERRHVLQGVHRILEIKPSMPWWDETPASKLVFIGRHLQQEALRERLQACLAAAPALNEALEAA